MELVACCVCVGVGKCNRRISFPDVPFVLDSAKGGARS